MMSLEAGLSKVGGGKSLLSQKDFGADDDDTFCGTGTVDGEIKRGNLKLKNNTAPHPFGNRPNPMASAPPFGGGSAFGSSAFGSSAFGDDDSEEEDEVDFFAGATNPFKDLKKKSTAKSAGSRRTAL